MSIYKNNVTGKWRWSIVILIGQEKRTSHRKRGFPTKREA